MADKSAARLVGHVDGMTYAATLGRVIDELDGVLALEIDHVQRQAPVAAVKDGADVRDRL